MSYETLLCQWCGRKFRQLRALRVHDVYCARKAWKINGRSSAGHGLNRETSDDECFKPPAAVRKAPQVQDSLFCRDAGSDKYQQLTSSVSESGRKIDARDGCESSSAIHICVYCKFSTWDLGRYRAHIRERTCDRPNSKSAAFGSPVEISSISLDAEAIQLFADGVSVTPVPAAVTTNLFLRQGDNIAHDHFSAGGATPLPLTVPASTITAAQKAYALAATQTNSVDLADASVQAADTGFKSAQSKACQAVILGEDDLPTESSLVIDSLESSIAQVKRKRVFPENYATEPFCASCSSVSQSMGNNVVARPSNSSDSFAVNLDKSVVSSELHALFSDANVISKAKKAIIVMFVTGNRTNPLPHLGSTLCIQLGEHKVGKDSHGQHILKQSFVSLNYKTGEWRRIERSRIMTDTSSE